MFAFIFKCTARRNTFSGFKEEGFFCISWTMTEEKLIHVFEINTNISIILYLRKHLKSDVHHNAPVMFLDVLSDYHQVFNLHRRKLENMEPQMFEDLSKCTVYEVINWIQIYFPFN